ncbi:uncharacterized protein K452DRAFT_246233 [Aplosporella prunicola CBS 121167]|uniref:Enoyl reductase (ER) domain-containing protein n=1 Tax=Aplosporella prunicola CBS 121167 TaxID=1176127 RepID=A0A6A6BJ80_9PEZI|nr:uncharacterized protein K452DRAFT_246233 [Aplosporella prunicola CBS 121167]KAF2144076.1 hypothetical protein K452DRAFT_246233 [Aplosporella prunicola CBS 121167]
MVKNQAAWITAGKAKPLKVDEAPEPKAEAGEVVIKNQAVAVNPVDWKVQDYDFVIKSYPNILGTDVAGIIEEVGEGVTRLHKGQRVIGHCHGLGTGETKHAAFQQYTVCAEILVSPIPDSLSFGQAVVLPLAISTAAAGLYQKPHLALPYPSKDAKPTGKSILVWGGASSVGGTAVQLAAASGVQVVATASSRNHDYVKSLGASKVIDYNSPSVEDDVVAALKEGDFAGVYDSISTPDTFKHIGTIVDKLGGGKIACVLTPPDDLPKSAQAQGVFAITIASEHKEVGNAIWREYVPEALASGRLQAKPDPLVVGSGLEKIQDGLDKQKAGVSAKKVVITL